MKLLLLSFSVLQIIKFYVILSPEEIFDKEIIMKRIKVKKIITIGLVGFITVFLSACNTQKTPSGDFVSDSVSDTVSLGEALTEDEYLQTLDELAKQISTITTEKGKELEKIDETDEQALKTMTKDLINSVSSYYKDLTSLNPPEEYQVVQQKIRSGAQAYLQALDVSLQLMEDPDNQELQQKGQQLSESAQTLVKALKSLGITYFQ